jgi:hypothetical protein
MIRNRPAISYLSLLLLIGASSIVRAQSDISQPTTDAQRAAAQAKQEQEMRTRSQAQLQDFLNGGLLRSHGLSGGPQTANLLDFRLAIPKFRVATDDFRWALGMNGKMDKPLKEMGSQADVMLRYMTSVKVKRPRQDTSEFKDFSQSELAWETLNSAERIAAYLDLAVQAEQLTVVTPQTMEFMSTLNGELQRLKWLTDHVR